MNYAPCEGPTYEPTNERLEVSLYICPTCSHIGKLPAGKFSAHCTGPEGSMHKRVRMIPRVFVERGDEG